MMRLGGPTFGDVSDPDKWIAELRRLGYSAAYCPLDEKADEATIAAYAEAARQADIVIAEVGAWSNPLAADETTRRKAIRLCQERLTLADKIGARCCVNITGSRGAVWDGPDASNFSEDTFDLIVATVREIIDAAQPTRTYYTLETMPWMLPDSPDAYLRLIAAIDRPRFAAHLDPVNMICSPRLFYGNGDFLRECFATLGPYIKGCHAKDVRFHASFVTRIDEVRPGLGELDYSTFLREAERLDPDLPIMLEHLPNAEEYAQAAEYVRSVAKRENIALK